MNSIWHAPSATISVQRLRDGLAARAQLAFDNQEEAPDDLDLSLFYQVPQGRRSILEARLTGLHPPSLGVFGAELAPLAGFDLPLQGTIQASSGGQRHSCAPWNFDIDALPGSD